ncbi:beta-carotene isomerase D27, chloroplastic [Melia azedarach]|uniref:Beta-carotene isomerase D27, chloroplastic n=2 Tax=Melia azedarach TaxID=155640 RepID=A0ACC1YVV6_MELAZ|nr:beta-carotene isomerase D27, chloroplastic [Melia azedarach]KAJ4727822.1 beta-carotene isomerase D27, chloroplastic [Melia azedarach]
MKSLALRPPIISSSPSHSHTITKTQLQNPRFRVSCSSVQSERLKSESATTRTEYKPGVLDDFFLNSFRNKLVQEVGLDSEKPGYDGLIELANRLMMKGKNNSDTSDASVRILASLFPPLVLKLYKILISPIAGGKIAAMMVARVTALTCQWLMGPCTVNSMDLPDGNSCQSGVFVERCKYLEESKCVGVCINTCKLPTQTFFKDYMGVPLLMEPNFSDYSCQFKFGILPPEPEEDAALKEPCLEICPTSSRQKEVITSYSIEKCPKA